MSCPHGEPHPSACIDCLEGPPAKVTPNTLPSTREREAQWSGRCAKTYTHLFDAGDTIRETAIGWCCTACAQPPYPTTGALQ